MSNHDRTKAFRPAIPALLETLTEKGAVRIERHTAPAGVYFTASCGQVTASGVSVGAAVRDLATVDHLAQALATMEHPIEPEPPEPLVESAAPRRPRRFLLLFLLLTVVIALAAVFGGALMWWAYGGAVGVVSGVAAFALLMWVNAWGYRFP